MIISMPMCSARNWRGEMVGFNGPVEVDDGDKDAVAWAKAWLNQGASLVEDVKQAEPVKAEPAKQEIPKQPVKAPAAKPAPKSEQKPEQDR